MRADKRVVIVVTWTMVVVLGALGAAIGWVGSNSRPPQYTSTAQLLWDPSALRITDDSAYVPDSASLALQVQAQALQVLSDRVVEPASTTLRMKPADLRKAMTVSVGSGSTAINIAATAGSPKKARAMTDAVVEVYSASVKTGIADQYSAQANALQSSIDSLTKQLAGLKKTDPLTGTVAGQIPGLVLQQQALQDKATAAPTPLSVVRNATLPDEPSTLSPLTVMIAGAGLGLLIGFVLLAFVLLRRSAVDRQVTSE